MGNHEHSIMCSLLCYIKVPGTQHLLLRKYEHMKGGKPTRATTVSYRHIMFTILPLVYHYADSAKITLPKRSVQII